MIKQWLKLLAFLAGTELAVSLFQERGLAGLAIGAIVAEVGAGSLLVAWSDPTRDPPPLSKLLARMGLGFALGTALWAGTFALARITGRMTTVKLDVHSGELLGALIPAILTAVRTELLFRGAPLRLTQTFLSTLQQIVFVSVLAMVYASASARGPIAIALEGAIAAVSAALWLRDRGAWLPFAFLATRVWVDMASRGLLFSYLPRDASLDLFQLGVALALLIALMRTRRTDRKSVAH